MKKIYLTITAIAVCSLTVLKTNAQTTIYNQNFDSLGLNLPTGWSSTASGWVMDSVTSNRSTGYTGVSGLFNCKISNGAGITGTYTLMTNSISTTGDSGISVIWGARRTTHFSDSASAIASFDFSTDGGTNWTNVPYTENAGNSTWSLDNAGARVMLPASANNQASLKFRWVAVLHSTPSGTYRIDDFNVQKATSTGITEIQNDNTINLYVDNNTLYINNSQSQSNFIKSELSIIDITGRVCIKDIITTSNSVYSLNELKAGIYFARISNNQNTFTKKIIISGNK